MIMMLMEEGAQMRLNGGERDGERLLGPKSVSLGGEGRTTRNSGSTRSKAGAVFMTQLLPAPGSALQNNFVSW